MKETLCGELYPAFTLVLKYDSYLKKKRNCKVDVDFDSDLAGFKTGKHNRRQIRNPGQTPA